MNYDQQIEKMHHPENFEPDLNEEEIETRMLSGEEHDVRDELEVTEANDKYYA